MTANDIFNNSIKVLKKNSPEILTGLAVAGVVSTAYLTAVASFKTKNRLEEEDPHERVWDQAKKVWMFYIPPAISGAATIACVIGSQKASGRRTTAAVAAYSLTEKAFSEYKDKVIEQHGKNKEQKVRDAIAQDHVDARPPSSEVLMLGTGDVLCCELYTKRYFKSDHESLRKKVNDINAMLVQSTYVTLDEFYDIVGLAHTSESDKVGWTSDKLMDLQFTTTMSESGEPCLAFEYNYVKPL